jgi:hypothetical protein
VLLPAQNLEEAAIQAAIAYYRADQNIYARQSDEEMEQLSKDLRMLLASIFLAVTKAADIGIRA